MFKNQLLLLLMVLTGALTPVCEGQTQSDNSATIATEASEKEIVMRLEREWYEAVKVGDRTALDRLLNDNFISQGRTKGAATKSDVLAGLQPGGEQQWSVKTKDVRVRIYAPDAAMATGRVSIKTLAPGEGESAGRSTKYTFTHMYVKRGGEWKIASEYFERTGEGR